MVHDFLFPGKRFCGANHELIIQSSESQESCPKLERLSLKQSLLHRVPNFFWLLDFYLLQQIYHVLDNFKFMAFLVLNLSRRAVPHPPVFYRKYHQGKRDRFSFSCSDLAAKS